MNKQMSSVAKLKMFLSLAWKISPSYILTLCANAVVGSAKIIANVLLPKFLIEELVGACNVNMIIIWVGAIVASNLVFNFGEKLLTYELSFRNIYISNQMEKALSDKIMAVEYSYLENPYYLDLKERARFVMSNQGAISQLVTYITTILKELVTVISLLAILFTLSWVLVVILVATIALTILIQALFQR
ncbi:MAG: hypothetical protein RR086_03805 [Clostridia bacterium]